ncbi:hypothetical protein, partial [Mycobacteroides abscessus]
GTPHLQGINANMQVVQEVHAMLTETAGQQGKLHTTTNRFTPTAESRGWRVGCESMPGSQT